MKKDPLLPHELLQEAVERLLVRMKLDRSTFLGSSFTADFMSQSESEIKKRVRSVVYLSCVGTKNCVCDEDHDKEILEFFEAEVRVILSDARIGGVE